MTKKKFISTFNKEAGVVDNINHTVSQNFGYKGLYGGMKMKDILARLNHMGSTELAANLFRATQTEDKLRRENIKGKQQANQTHYEVGQKVRKTIKELGGTMPENLPAPESIKKVERKLKSEEKKALKNKSKKKTVQK